MEKDRIVNHKSLIGKCIDKVIIGLLGFEKNKDDEMNRDYESLNNSDEYYLVFHRGFCLRNVYR